MVAVGGSTAGEAGQAEERQLVVQVHGNQARLVKVRPLVIRVVTDGPGSDLVLRIEVFDSNGYGHHGNYAEYAQSDQGRLDGVQVSFGSVGTEQSSSSATSSVVLTFVRHRACCRVLDDVCHGFLPDFLVSVYPSGVAARGEWGPTAQAPAATAGAAHIRRVRQLRDAAVGGSSGASFQDTQVDRGTSKGVVSFTVDGAPENGSESAAAAVLVVLRILTPLGMAWTRVAPGTMVGAVKAGLVTAMQGKAVKSRDSLSSWELAHVAAPPVVLGNCERLVQPCTLRVLTAQGAM
jgi:hypothetical protein